MAQHNVTVCCWNCSHQEVMGMTLRQEQSLEKKVDTLKAVCPKCRDDGKGNMPIFIKYGDTVMSPNKVYKCRHGHSTAIGAFANGYLNVTFGPNHENFFNIEGTPEDLEELIDTKEISCHHVRENNKMCDCKLKEVDDYSISIPIAGNIKTKTRIGDIWDKQGVEPVRNGSYDKNGNYNATKSEAANRERLKTMRKRNMSEDKHPGKRITKSTKANYGRKSKNEIDMN